MYDLLCNVLWVRISVGCVFLVALCGVFCVVFFFQAEDGIRDAQESRGLGDVYKRTGKKIFPGESFVK